MSRVDAQLAHASTSSDADNDSRRGDLGESYVVVESGGARYGAGSVLMASRAATNNNGSVADDDNDDSDNSMLTAAVRSAQQRANTNNANNAKGNNAASANVKLPSTTTTTTSTTTTTTPVTSGGWQLPLTSGQGTMVSMSLRVSRLALTIALVENDEGVVAHISLPLIRCDAFDNTTALSSSSSSLNDAQLDALTSSLVQWRVRLACSQCVVADHLRASTYRNLLALATRRRDLVVELCLHASLLPYQPSLAVRVASGSSAAPSGALAGVVVVQDRCGHVFFPSRQR